MAGFTYNSITHEEHQFHIGDENIAEKIRQANKNLAGKMSRSVILQLDGDELDAALWGLENYKKNSRSEQASVYMESDPNG